MVVLSFLVLSSCTRPFSPDHRPGFRDSGARMFLSGGMNGASGSDLYDSSRSRTRNPSASGAMMPDVQESSPQNNTSTQSSSTLTPPSAIQPTSSQGENLEKYVSYNTPEGLTSANFSISLDSNKIVTAINVTMVSGEHESREFIQKFNNAAKQSIVGKKITDLSLDAVGGASLTTGAFNKLIQTL